VVRLFNESPPASADHKYEAERLLASVRMNLGQLMIAEKDPSALANLETSNDIRSKIPREAIKSDSLQFALTRDNGMGNYNLAKYYTEVAPDSARTEVLFQSSIVDFDQATEFAAELVETDAEVRLDIIELARLRAVSTRMLADAISNSAIVSVSSIESKQDKLNQAIVLYDDAIGRMRQLATDNPRIVKYAEELAAVVKNQALAYLRLAELATVPAAKTSQLIHAYKGFNEAAKLAETLDSTNGQQVRNQSLRGVSDASNANMKSLRENATADDHRLLGRMTEEYAGNVFERLQSNSLRIESLNVKAIYESLQRLLELDPKKASAETVVAFWKCKWLFERFNSLAEKQTDDVIKSAAKQYLLLIDSNSGPDN
jgi:hypothetical protein